MGYPTGFDADIECMSSDEKSDNEGKNETVSSNSSNNTGNSTTETSSTLEVYLYVFFSLEKNGVYLDCRKLEMWKSIKKKIKSIYRCIYFQRQPLLIF